jgi:hypothetical protein
MPCHAEKRKFQSALKRSEIHDTCPPLDEGRRVHQRRSARTSATPGGDLLEKDIRLVELELEVRNLKQQVEMLMCLVDPQDVRAATELQLRSPSNEQLRLWSQSPIIPSGLAEQQEERPW